MRGLEVGQRPLKGVLAAQQFFLQPIEFLIELRSTVAHLHRGREPRHLGHELDDRECSRPDGEGGGDEADLADDAVERDRPARNLLTLGPHDEKQRPRFGGKFPADEVVDRHRGPPRSDPAVGQHVADDLDDLMALVQDKAWSDAGCRKGLEDIEVEVGHNARIRRDFRAPWSRLAEPRDRPRHVGPARRHDFVCPNEESVRRIEVREAGRIGGHGLGRAEEEQASGLEPIGEHLQDPVLEGRREVDERVAARDEIEPSEGRVLRDVMPGEDHEVAQFGRDLDPLAAWEQVPRTQVRWDRAQGCGRVGTPAGDRER
ncbi:unannotated protein [freshwater metagenome]|uniref:Unannotated protein n=1 Tax=freshwater metagenome TaxID=449393 RepID=A0A6J7EPF6_9ZZZZ